MKNIKTNWESLRNLEIYLNAEQCAKNIKYIYYEYNFWLPF